MMEMTRATRGHRGRRGIAAVTAIVLLGLVAAALLVVSTAVVADGRRTRAAVADAQLRQLLLAAAADAAARSESWAAEVEPQSWSLALPPSLAQDGASAKVSATPAGEDVEVRVEAQLPQRRAGQTLRFRRADGRWQLQEATPDTATTDAATAGRQPQRAR